MSKSGVPSSHLARRDTLLSRLCGQRWPYEPLLSRLNLPPEADVLDIGAGDGALLRTLRQCGHTGRLAGLDSHPGAGIERGSAEALPYPDETFEVVIFLRVLAHLPDPALALAEARRVLRPGGLLVMAANGRQHLRRFWAALERPAQATAAPDAAGVLLPVTILPGQARALAQSYGLEFYAPAPFCDTLHLSLQTTKKP